MKAVLRIAIAAVSAAIAFSSCENLNDEYMSVSEEIVINASVAEQSVETRSAIDVFGSEKVTYTWLAGDAISVFFGDSEGSIFVTDVTASKAQFKGTIGAVTGGGDDLTDETSLWGVYPYGRNTTCDGSSVTLTLPYEQGAAPDTFADDLFPSIARSTNFTMAFYPVCGSIRFKVSNPDIVKVTLSGNNNEDLAGKATVSMPLGGVPAMNSISEGQKELVMTAPDGGCFETDRYYYFVLYPQTLTKGLTLTYYKEDEKASYVLNSSVKVGRNRFLSATNKDSGLTFTGIQGGEIGGEGDDEEELVIPALSVILSSTLLRLNTGEQNSVVATFLPIDANSPVTWYSDAPYIAYVDQKGGIIAISEGTAKITVVTNDVSAECTVIVSSNLLPIDYVDEYGVNHGKGIAIGIATWAPVNCGYHETDYPYGKLYQWGRKYGQGYSGTLYEDGKKIGEISDATYPSVEAGTIKEGGVSLAGAQSVTNKDVFFLGYEDNNYDWVYPSDDKLWNLGTESAPIKNTDNDPCPDGWRIPTWSEFIELAAHHSDITIDEFDQKGFWLSGPCSYAEGLPQVFFPLPGAYDVFAKGEYRDIYGYYWSSSVIADKVHPNRARYMMLSNEPSLTGGATRARGYSVRCVRE